jgi:hypothetical protein
MKPLKKVKKTNERMEWLKSHYNEDELIQGIQKIQITTKLPFEESVRLFYIIAKNRKKFNKFKK